jgi:hypothetical protein
LADQAQWRRYRLRCFVHGRMWESARARLGYAPCLNESGTLLIGDTESAARMLFFDGDRGLADVPPLSVRSAHPAIHRSSKGSLGRFICFSTAPPPRHEEKKAGQKRG